MNERQRRHEIAQRHRFFRRWHRWIGIGAAAFLLFAAITGFLVAFTEFFGADERLREANRKLTSPVTSATPMIDWQPSVEAAIAAIQASGSKPIDPKPIDKITVEFKGAKPRILIFTGKVGGGEDSKYVVDAKSGKLLATETYRDKPFLTRVHSGEAFGDGGLVVAMLWAIALVLMSASGIYVYFSMRRRANIED